MSFSRFVELGRIVMITYGPDQNKLATIVDVIDNNRVLVDGPVSLTGVHRHAINLKRVQLTDIVIPAKLNASSKCAHALPSMATPSWRACLLLFPGGRHPPLQLLFLALLACLPAWLGAHMADGSPPCPARVHSCLVLARHIGNLSPACVPAPPPVRRTLKALWESEGVQAAWDATTQAKKRKARAARAASTDFERFQIQVAKSQRSAKRKEQ